MFENGAPMKRPLRSLVSAHALPALAMIGALLVAGCRASGPRAVEVTDRAEATGPRVLVVTAHPDDESACAASLYKITTWLDGACDLAVLTNGEGGFKYATLSERIYGLELTDEATGRAELPEIRKAELFAAGRVLGLRRIAFFDQIDHRYTQDPHEVLDQGGPWDVESIRERLTRLMQGARYDFVFLLAPTPETHGHHQAATILAMEAARDLPSEERPVLLAVKTRESETEPYQPALLEGYPITEIDPREHFVFDRRQTFGHRNRLDYRIVVNWVIAAHKSQGTMQLFVNRGDQEVFYPFALNREGALERATALFERLAEPQFLPRTYGETAGTNAAPR